MSTLMNEFSWSHSRHQIFQTCLKRYFFAYYGAWRGWEDSAPAPTRDLYILKRLSTRQQWAGHHVHSAIETLVKQARQDAARAAVAEPRQIELMRREFCDSRAGAYRQNPVRTPALFEHEYQLNVSPEEWKATVERVSTAIRGFLASDLWQQLQTLPNDAVLAVERRAHFILDGLKVHAVPDLVIRRDGGVVIYDWKTGISPLTEHRLQLGIYALLAMERWTADPAEIETVAYNPLTGQQESFRFSADDLETLRDFIRDSADEMLFPLEVPEQNLAGDGTHFDCTDSPAPCPTCPFLRVCPRWTP